MNYKPVTDKQLTYLISLFKQNGIEMSRKELIDLSIQDASQLIEQLKASLTD